MQEQPCALRALTLCDGQVLEHPDRALTECLCAALSRSESSCAADVVGQLRQDKQELIEATLAAPPLPLPAF